MNSEELRNWFHKQQQLQEEIYSDYSGDANYLCPAGRVQRGLPPFKVWQWVRFDGIDGLSDWMPAKKVGKYWSSVGWAGLTPAVYGPEILTPESP